MPTGNSWDPVQILHFQSSLGKAKRECYAWILLIKLLIRMSSTQCCVPTCYKRGGHQFPHGDPKRNSAWVNDIQCVWPKGPARAVLYAMSVWIFCCNRLPYRNHAQWVLRMTFIWNWKPSDTDMARVAKKCRIALENSATYVVRDTAMEVGAI